MFSINMGLICYHYTYMHTDGTFTTRLHYNGILEEGFGKNYVNSELQYVHKCDPDRWSKLEVDVIGLEYYYRIPRMSSRMEWCGFLTTSLQSARGQCWGDRCVCNSAGGYGA